MIHYSYRILRSGALSFVLTLLVFSSRPLFAQPTQLNAVNDGQTNTSSPFKFITLTDGTQLRGRLIAVNNDIYTFETTSLGQLNIHGDNILSINSSNNGPASTTQENGTTQTSITEEQRQQAKDLQQQMMSDPETMDEIKSLSQDPELLDILSDQDLVKDILSYDIEKIKQNPKAMQLFENDKIQNLIQKIGQKNGQLAQ